MFINKHLMIEDSSIQEAIQVNPSYLLKECLLRNVKLILNINLPL